jgi:amino acid adenylation domain-containing protein
MILHHAERHQLLVEGNETERAYPKDRCLHELFEAQVERTPSAVAVVFEAQQLTYAELNARANQLAHHLRRRGVGPEVVVGICLERSLEMVVGLLGILKAGGAYLPLDPAYPKDRLAFLLADAQIAVLLTQEWLAAELASHRAQVMCLDSASEVIARQSKENPISGVGADDLAYVIYTSGSTGQPKGVLISHRNVTPLLTATQSCFHFDGQDVWTLFHSSAFDFSVWEMWGALSSGGRLVVVPGWMTRSPDSFYELLCQERVTVLNQTPSAFYQLLRVEEEIGAQTGDRVGELALRLIIFGGEALEVGRLRPWFERHGDERPQLVNMYGITETTVHVTYRRLSLADLSQERGSPIGRPLPDLQLYLLDQQLQPVPLGVPGELHVGGQGLSRGYLNRPELTAERFIPNPFSQAPGARLYKTGDLARYLSNGELVYLGRSDHQVKIRGYRIELGEIEVVLSQHPGVRDVVVAARQEGSGELHLVAYVVLEQETAPATNELRSFLKEKLPEYMVPASFVVLETLPLTPSGKLDRAALPAPEPARPNLESPFVAPRTPVDEELAEIWRGLLGIERIGIRDNFFELGGHSLLLTQLGSRIQQAFQVQVPLRILFDAPTITDLSAAIAAAQVAQEDACEVAHMLEELKQLSPDEVRALLEAEMGGQSERPRLTR